ncbi:MAG TPA: phenylalanine--tRNA ligase beta subunit-related protein [Anaerolineae bacterium]|nr:phenylalanine--tRNA ligase beta subunit-related protein [Anaerolineae bacterium]
MTDQYRFGYPTDFLDKFPSVVGAAAFALGIDNLSNETAAEGLLRAQEEVVRAQFASTPLSSHPHISSWRSAFSSFGVKPTQYRSAIEALLRHVTKKGSVPHINKLVDLCNYVSMKHVLPVAAYDLDHISGPVVVSLARGDEPFLPLYGKQVEYPKLGEVIFTDDKGALSRRWTWRQSDRAKSTPETRNALLTIEGVNRITLTVIEGAMEELVSLVKEHCVGEVSWSTVDRDHPWAAME